MSENNIDEYKGQEDPNMEESFVPDLDSITNYKKTGPNDVSIQVCNPVVKEEKFSKYVAYCVKGSDTQGTFEAIRRYKDFDRIRATLVLRWPGCYIPPLPPKQVSNMEGRFVEERMRHLHAFCRKVAELPYLYNSEEFQVFIRSQNPDQEKALAPFQKVNVDDLIAKYSVSFSHLSGKELNNETVMRINNFKMFLQKSYGYFENYKKIARAVAHAKRNFYRDFAQFHQFVCVEYEKNVFTEYHNNSSDKNIFTEGNSTLLNDKAEKVKEASTQPSLEYLYEWIKLESREIEAFIEAINQRDKYEALKTQCQEKQKADTISLQNVLAGKTTMKTLFSRKPKEEEVSNLEQKINKAGKEMESYIMIHDMITLIIAYNEIDRFKTNKLEQYYRIIKLAASHERNNVHNLVEYWNVVGQSNNVKTEQ